MGRFKNKLSLETEDYKEFRQKLRNFLGMSEQDYETPEKQEERARASVKVIKRNNGDILRDKSIRAELIGFEGLCDTLALTSNQKSELMKDLAILGNFFVSKNQAAECINKKYKLCMKNKKINYRTINKAINLYAKEIKFHLYGEEAAANFRKKQLKVLLPGDEEKFEKFEELFKKNKYTRSTRNLTFQEKLKIYQKNKTEGISAEKLAKEFMLESKKSIYSINKQVKKILSSGSENFMSCYEPHAEQEDFDYSAIDKIQHNPEDYVFRMQESEIKESEYGGLGLTNIVSMKEYKDRKGESGGSLDSIAASPA